MHKYEHRLRRKTKKQKMTRKLIGRLNGQFLASAIIIIIIKNAHEEIVPSQIAPSRSRPYIVFHKIANDCERMTGSAGGKRPSKQSKRRRSGGGAVEEIPP